MVHQLVGECVTEEMVNGMKVKSEKRETRPQRSHTNKDVHIRSTNIDFPVKSAHNKNNLNKRSVRRHHDDVTMNA